MSEILSGDLRSSLPAQIFIILGAGQPQLMSIISNCFSSFFADSRISVLFEPKIWTALGFSILSVFIRFFVFSFPLTIAELLTNSVYVSAAPYFLHNILKATSVMPDIGARIALPLSFGNDLGFIF